MAEFMVRGLTPEEREKFKKKVGKMNEALIKHIRETIEDGNEEYNKNVCVLCENTTNEEDIKHYCGMCKECFRTRDAQTCWEVIQTWNKKNNKPYHSSKIPTGVQ